MRVLQKQWWLILLISLFLMLPALGAAQAEGAQINGIVWLEKTVDGAFSNESGFANAKVSLEKREADGTVNALATLETDRDGIFAFSVSAAGEYRLSVELPSDYQFTVFGTASSALPAQGNRSVTPFFSLTDGQFATKNIGVTKTSSYISIIAFEDENANGGRMLSEALVKDVLVELIVENEGESYVVATAVTDRKGETSIRSLSPGAYRLRTVLPDNYVIGPLGQKINTYYNCILAEEDNTGVSAPFTLDPKGSLGIGVGLVKTGSLTGTIWFDENDNGAWDAGEGGLGGAALLLHSDALSLTRETTPDASGHYSFRGLQPGDYRLEVRLPEGMIFTYPGHSLLSQIAASGTLNVSVQVDTETALGAIGAMPAASLSLSFYQDMNQNGRQDSDESPLAGAEIQVSQGGSQVAHVVADGNGVAVVPTLRSGEATLSCHLPDGYVLAPGDGVFAVSSAAFTGEATVAVDGPDTAYTAGVTTPVSLSGMLFEDPLNQGLYQAGYALLSGFRVQAVNENGDPVLETTTDENGAYILYPLLPGTYAVRFLLTDPYIATPYAADAPSSANHILTQTPQYGETEQITLAPGESKAGLDGGVFRAGVVDGFLFISQIPDQAPDSGAGMAGAVVTLLDEYGAPVSDYSYGVTDENGYYYIKGALPGEYSLLYTLPQDCAFTSPMTESNETQSDPITIGSGSEIHMPALGCVPTATLAGWVRGLEGERPVPARITLTAQSRGTVYETETLSDGQYILSGLRPDTYSLTVTLPEGYVFAEAEGSPVAATAYHQATAALSFALGESRLDADIHAALPASFAGAVYYDANLSGTREADEGGAEDRSFSLWRNGQEIAVLTTNAEGAFASESLVPGEYTLRMALDDQEIMVGDAGRDADEWTLPVTLGDGEQVANYALPILRYASVTGQVWSLDGTLNGVSGIAVTLLDSMGNSLMTASANAQGAFAFEQLLPGEYSLAATLPEGYLFAREQDAAQRESAVVSLPDGTNSSLPFQLDMGDDLSGKDIGIGAMGCIGDRAWLDENGNGMQDLGEPDMPGILIELYQRGELIASAITDIYGHYSLAGLYPGEYEMRVTMHKELKATLHQTDFPLVGSILPESDETTVTVTGVIVPSGGQILHDDLGFQLRKKGVYPDAMKEIPTKDWRPYADR